jgi:TolB-like protein
MLIKKWAAALVTFLLCNGYIFAAQRTVAVLNFTNYGGAGINYLSNALPESVSASLSEIKEIRVVERRNLGDLLNEIALEQTGVINTQGVDRVGKMAKADVLILGSISGDPENINVTLKAVEVETGKVLDAKTVKGHISKIFDLSSQAARSMGARISGQGVGKLSLSTNPSGADVYIDGVQVGKSPIVEYALTEGKHTVKAALYGHLDFDETIDIKVGVHEKLSPMMIESKTRNMSEAGGGVSYFWPIGTPEDILGAPYYYLYIGHSFNKIKIGFELGFGSFKHDQKFTWFGVEKIRLRSYGLFVALVQITYSPFDWQYISPFFGGFVGYSNLSESALTESESVSNRKEMVNLGPTVGLTLIPYSRISLVLEGKFFYQPMPVSRAVYGQQGIGALQVVSTDKFMFNAFTMGGSVKYNF